MKLMILTGKFGMGHYSASLSLQQHLLRAFPQAEVEVIDFFAYASPNGSETLYKMFSLLVTHGSGLYNTYYKLTENLSPDSLPLLAALYRDKLEELLEQRRPDGVIATHPLCAQIVSYYKEETGARLPLITCVTDLSSHSEWITANTDCYLVGDFEIKKRLVEKGVNAQAVCVTGIPVKEEFKGRSRRWDGGERHLLIMGGGLGLMPKRGRFYEELDCLPHVKTTIIAGRNEKLYRRLKGKYENIEVVGFTDRVYDYMAWADLMLSKPGGITLFETIFSELPILAWDPFLQQERNNARFLRRTGIGRVAEREPERCLAAVRELIYNDEALEWMAGHMRRMKSRLEMESADRIFAALARGERVCA